MMCIGLWVLVVGLCLAECSTLNIPSQLQQRFRVINTTENVLAKEYLENKFPFLKSECITDALKSFLPICLNKGIEAVDSALRVETAVKLSICEFKASGLDYIPDSCESWDVESMMDCMIKLESSAQWWTTYSGNYQRLSAICFENSLPYEKQQILDLFLNVTAMYSDITDTLNAQFHEMINNSEEASKRHMKDMADMFQEYIDDLSQRAKSHEEEVENDFMAHKAEIQALIIRNSAELENELTKKDAHLTESFDFIVDAIDRIANEINHMDIADEINGRNRAALEKWADVEEMMQELRSTQNETNVQMSREWKCFVASATEDMSALSSNIINSQNRALEVLNDYDSLMRDRIVPSITEDIFPQLQDLNQQLLFEWRETVGIIAQDVLNWNNEVAHSFEALSQNLNDTMEKVIDLDNRVSRLHGLFDHIQNTIDILIRVVRYNCMFLSHLLINRTFWVLVIMSFPAFKIKRILSHKMLVHTTINLVRSMLKCSLVLIMIFIGYRVGSLIVSNKK